MNKLITIFFLFNLFFPGIVQAQDRTIKGKIISDNDEPLPGVNVVVKGTTNGTITDVDGNYEISVSGSEATLLFSFIGYTSEEIMVGDQT
ncbi:MAG: hypothetical protein HC906_16200, partial [Bacteroidales bacterium]|nr:hypothetical protein [Bacteroidales bacterium]